MGGRDLSLQLRPFAVQFTSRFAVSFVGGFGRIKRTKVVPVAVQFYSSDPSLCPDTRHSLIPTGVVFLRTSVSMVFGRGGFTKIFPPVISSVFVRVVDFVLRPISCYPKPYYSVDQVPFPVDSYAVVPSGAYRSCNGVTGLSTSCRGFPYKRARFFVVAEYFFNVFLSKIVSCVFMFHGLESNPWQPSCQGGGRAYSE